MDKVKWIDGLIDQFIDELFGPIDLCLPFIFGSVTHQLITQLPNRFGMIIWFGTGAESFLSQLARHRLVPSFAAVELEVCTPFTRFVPPSSIFDARRVKVVPGFPLMLHRNLSDQADKLGSRHFVTCFGHLLCTFQKDIGL
jgi:hypothetical protein